ncbi:MAG TPA: hypothetical protein VLH79_02045 [Chthonomonadales bacterium]|nr:hypothetical protein [Chthonomonadales bacterium]
MAGIEPIGHLTPVRLLALRPALRDQEVTPEQRVAALQSRVEARLDREVESIRARLGAVLEAAPEPPAGAARGRLDVLA